MSNLIPITNETNETVYFEYIDERSNERRETSIPPNGT